MISIHSMPQRTMSNYSSIALDNPSNESVTQWLVLKHTVDL